ncbi:hypothetical protein [Clostridium hydrogenum]|uniref:hypothetical protein n=1 Tax=Clostridium hydrogenum TaxID=2855764 RepID=UPI001F33FB02|nr:hypothetical protein [Clostridium hydrogenum]
MVNKIIENFLGTTYEKLKLDFEKKALIEEMYGTLINDKENIFKELENDANTLKNLNNTLETNLNDICIENENLTTSISTLEQILTQNIYK